MPEGDSGGRRQGGRGSDGGRRAKSSAKPAEQRPGVQLVGRVRCSSGGSNQRGASGSWPQRLPPGSLLNYQPGTPLQVRPRHLLIRLQRPGDLGAQ